MKKHAREESAVGRTKGHGKGVKTSNHEPIKTEKKSTRQGNPEQITEGNQDVGHSKNRKPQVAPLLMAPVINRRGKPWAVTSKRGVKSET